MNILGNMGGNNPHLSPYYDYTGYRPVNLPTHIKDPTHWQPSMLIRGEGHFGAFVSQHFITPQLRNVKPFAFKKDINKVVIQPPGRSDKVTNTYLYQK